HPAEYAAAAPCLIGRKRRRVGIRGQYFTSTLCDHRQRLADRDQIIESCRGEGQVARAIEKLNIEPFFERADAVTNCPGRQIQFLCSDFKTAATSGSFKESQAIERRDESHAAMN